MFAPCLLRDVAIVTMYSQLMLSTSTLDKSSSKPKQWLYLALWCHPQLGPQPMCVRAEHVEPAVWVLCTTLLQYQKSWTLLCNLILATNLSPSLSCYKACSNNNISSCSLSHGELLSHYYATTKSAVSVKILANFHPEKELLNKLELFQRPAL